MCPLSDRAKYMQPCGVKLNIYQCSVLACCASQKPKAGLTLTLFHHLGFGNTSLFMLWLAASRLAAEAMR